MTELTTYALEDGVCTITLNDGKANVLSPEMLRQINRQLDRAQADQAVVVLTGRPGTFSGGFDLNVFKTGGPAAIEMLSAGAALSERLLSFPAPVVIACSARA